MLVEGGDVGYRGDDELFGLAVANLIRPMLNSTEPTNPPSAASSQ
ncbi:hypothetical protein ACIGMX_33105 [Streptomyces aquilus]